MRGHLPLISMRRQRAVPQAVFVDVDIDPFEQWRTWPTETPNHAHLLVEAVDAPRRLDLRCVVGLTVIVTGFDDARVEAVFEACRSAGAARVIGASGPIVAPGVVRTTWDSDTAEYGSA